MWSLSLQVASSTGNSRRGIINPKFVDRIDSTPAKRSLGSTYIYIYMWIYVHIYIYIYTYMGSV